MEAVAGPATIEPGGSGQIIVRFRRPMAGMRDLVVLIRSDDPVAPEQKLLLRFEIVAGAGRP